jgi:hypothetical protein
MINVLDERCKEHQNTHLCSITFFENLAFYEIMSKGILELDRPRVKKAHALCMLYN